VSNSGNDSGFLDFSPLGGGLDDFDALYHRYHRAVYANILKMVRKPEAAEDLLQEVFLALWVHHATIERARVANWLFVVSYNKTVSHLKKIRNNPSLDHGWEIEPEDRDAGIEMSEEEFEERLARIEEAIEHLPDRKREIFHLYRFEGMTSEEIASVLDISVHTVKDHLKVANKSIRAYLFEKYHYTLLAEIALLTSCYFR
jgi:RNA polymerase sigma-70 factor (family 1)